MKTCPTCRSEISNAEFDAMRRRANALVMKASDESLERASLTSATAPPSRLEPRTEAHLDFSGKNRKRPTQKYYSVDFDPEDESCSQNMETGDGVPVDAANSGATTFAERKTLTVKAETGGGAIASFVATSKAENLPVELTSATEGERDALKDDVWWNSLFIERQKFILEWGKTQHFGEMGDSLVDTLMSFWAEIHARATAGVGAESPWVNVQDRLPEINDDVEYVLVKWKEEYRGKNLSSYDGDPDIASPCGLDTCFISYLRDNSHFITHWMPLPSAPTAARAESPATGSVNSATGGMIRGNPEKNSRPIEASPSTAAKEKTMEEVYTCSCGNQSFIVYSDRVGCTRCGDEIVVHISQPPSDFNNALHDVKKNKHFAQGKTVTTASAQPEER